MYVNVILQYLLLFQMHFIFCFKDNLSKQIFWMCDACLPLHTAKAKLSLRKTFCILHILHVSPDCINKTIFKLSNDTSSNSNVLSKP